jgi:hypothetical protein
MKLRFAPLLSVLAATLGLVLPGAAPASQLDPLIPGVFDNGDGANSHWVQVVDDWRGAIYGQEPWGTGIWGLADHALVLGMDRGSKSVVQTWSGRVDTINFGDLEFLEAWGATWGVTELPPFFTVDPSEYQDNYAVRFWGYLAVTAPGAYNLGVLYDDGFRLTLQGAGGATDGIEQDGLNPRDREGFADDLLLSPGLYAYTLDAYERIEAGVVNLSWLTPGSDDWTPVPRSHLFTTPVPAPPVLALLAPGLVLLLRRRRGFRAGP